MANTPGALVRLADGSLARSATTGKLLRYDADGLCPECCCACCASSCNDVTAVTTPDPIEDDCLWAFDSYGAYSLAVSDGAGYVLYRWFGALCGGSPQAYINIVCCCSTNRYYACAVAESTTYFGGTDSPGCVAGSDWKEITGDITCTDGLLTGSFTLGGLNGGGAYTLTVDLDALCE